MGDLQFHLLESIALAAAPLLFAAAASVATWRNMPHRLLFFIVSVLALFGIAASVHPFVFDYMWPDRLSPVTKVPNIIPIHAVIAVLTAVLGFPLLWWLRKGLTSHLTIRSTRP